MAARMERDSSDARCGSVGLAVLATLRRLLNARSTTALLPKYALFALIATAANLGAQWIVMRALAGPHGIYAAILTGTGAGLIVKYILDKRYVFFHATRDRKHNLATFVLYTLMGVVTTVVFWGTELLFHFAFPHPDSAYLGGLIGLMIGYTTKFFLDRRWVFR